jgi:hypothetical protein
LLFPARAPYVNKRGEMGRRASPKTDFGTVILHWTLVTLFVICVVTGLRIATVSPFDFGWIYALDSILPSSMVWTAHVPVAVALFGLAFAYAVYIRRAGLMRRIRPDRVRLMGIFRGGQACWVAFNTMLTWLILLTMLEQLVTGYLVYLGYGGMAVELHRDGTWLLIAISVGHVATHWAIGGLGQIARIFRPSRLPPVAPPFDPFELLVAANEPTRVAAIPGPGKEHTQRDQHSDTRDEPRREQRRAPQRDVTLQSHPFAAAMMVGLVAMSAATFVDQTTMRETLHVRKIAASEAPVLDGDISDPVWRTVRPVVVLTNQGANFDGTGSSEVEIRAVHDGDMAYFAFVWSDSTRSLKHLPLIKRADGWYVLQTNYDSGDEHHYHEDKFSVLLGKNAPLLAGDRTFHAGRAPIDGKPATFSGRGLHYTMNDSFVDVWQWKATRGGLLGFIDDGHFGPPAEPTRDQIAGQSPYKGGYAADPGTANYADNFEPRGPGGYQRPVKPKRLPKNWQATWSAMGRVDLNPNVGESEGARWWMTEAESVPYSPEADAQFPLNALIPGVLIIGQYSGDRADVRGAARWAAGRWALEIARRLDTGSQYDTPIATGVAMRVAAFDRAQIRHTRHIRPIQLEVE